MIEYIENRDKKEKKISRNISRRNKEENQEEFGETNLRKNNKEIIYIKRILQLTEKDMIYKKEYKEKNKEKNTL